ncbi:MAG: zinc-ribbon domain-containing protein [Peptoanaerobacter stomatis]|uniref:zinc-ribbon domain-containing protein n=1 Tax=Peptoanaerobacter stomatis TaxID=796937 RepID=UPI003F9FD5F0
MFCDKCGTEIEEGVSFCHICGSKIDISTNLIYNEENKQPKRTYSLGKIILIAIVAIPILYFIISFLHEYGETLALILIAIAFLSAVFIGSKEEKIEARKAIVQIVMFFIIIGAIAYVLIYKEEFIGNIIYPGYNIRNSYLTQYSDTVTVEEAFENYFRNTKWEAYKSNEYSYVSFTGSCEYLGKPADVKIIFKILGEQYSVERLDLNGVEQSDLMLYAILSSIYNK